MARKDDIVSSGNVSEDLAKLLIGDWVAGSGLQAAVIR